MYLYNRSFTHTYTVEHIYDACPKYSKWGSFPIKALATVAATDSASTVRKKYSVFIYSEAEPHAMYTIYKQTLTLCVLQFMMGVYLFHVHIGFIRYICCV